MYKVKPFEEKPRLADGNIQICENSLLNAVYLNRGVTSEEDLKYGLAGLLPPSTMKGVDDACDLLVKHFKKHSKILIIGDYDCDGATATSIAMEGLSMLAPYAGDSTINFIIPDRAIHGYGLSPAIVKIAGELKPDLIVTVDNGISSFDGAKAVKALSHPCELLITDHHLAPQNGVPDAEVIVNPNQVGCTFESKNIAGCGVMFYVVTALRKKMREMGFFENKPEPNIASLLDLVALGTVADVVALDKNNRILVNAGLNWINSGRARPGIQALLTVANKEIGKIVASDFGFAIGPRLNSAGRLDDMTVGICCLLEKDSFKAMELAKFLDDLNGQRKELQQEMSDEAKNIAIDLDSDYFGLTLYDETWHEGVVGIVASRIKELANKPVVCFTDTKDLQKAKEQGGDIGEQMIKGSARSVPGVHLKHLFDEIHKTNPEVLEKFGGHAMAAGLSIKLKNLPKFKAAFDSLVRRDLTQEMIDGKVEVDIKDLSSEHLTIENAKAIEEGGPWGQSFPEPLFSAKFYIQNYRVLKDAHIKFTLKPVDSDMTIDAIAFNCVEEGQVPFYNDGILEASFKLSINEWKGKTNLQLMIDYFQDREWVLNYNCSNDHSDDFEVDGLKKDIESDIKMDAFS